MTDAARGTTSIASTLRSLAFLLFQIVVTPFYAVVDAGARSGCRGAALPDRRAAGAG